MTSVLSACTVYTAFAPQALLWGLTEVGVVHTQMIMILLNFVLSDYDVI